MKKILLLLVLFSFFIEQVQAHPLDISTNFVSIKRNTADVTTYLHSFEVEYLLSKLGIVPRNIWVYYENENKITNYIKENTKFYNAWKECSIKDVYLPKMEDYEVLSRWLQISYKFDCSDKIEAWEIQLSLFTNFLLQANKLTIYDLNNWIENLSPKKYSVLTSKISKTDFDINKTELKKKDSDWDGISDDDEAIYKTDPYNIDTDKDNWTDYEEVTSSFDPINKNPGPWQWYREEIPPDVKNQAEITKKDKINEIKNDSSKWLAYNFYWVDFLEKTLKSISEYINWKWNFIYVFLIVVALWFVHAFGPGHSKTILISYIVDKNKSFLDWLVFALIFSITHIIDIIIVFIIAKFVLSYYDISNYIVYIQRFSRIILVFISFYLVYKNIKNIKSKKIETCNETNDTKSKIFLWFLTWLAPCSFGWSIFLLLFSLGNFSLIPILIFALWLWIFICLLLVLIITMIIRKKIFEKINIFSVYSGLVSSSMILIFSFYILYFLY